MPQFESNEESNWSFEDIKTFSASFSQLTQELQNLTLAADSFPLSNQNKNLNEGSLKEEKIYTFNVSSHLKDESLSQKMKRWKLNDY